MAIFQHNLFSWGEAVCITLLPCPFSLWSVYSLNLFCDSNLVLKMSNDSCKGGIIQAYVAWLVPSFSRRPSRNLHCSSLQSMNVDLTPDLDHKWLSLNLHNLVCPARCAASCLFSISSHWYFTQAGHESSGLDTEHDGSSHEGSLP